MRFMNKKNFIILISVISILTMVSLKMLNSKTINSAKQIGSIQQELIRQKLVDRTLIQNQYLLIHFWAKWCEPCIEEMPKVLEFSKKIENESELSSQMKLLAISLDPNLEDSKSLLPENGKALPSNFILISDPMQTFAEYLGSYQYPESYWIDPQGEVVQKWVGPQKWDQPEVLEYFKKSLKP